MQLEVLSVKGTVLSCEVSSVVLPGLQGSFGLLPGHTPFLSILRKGHLYYTDTEEKSLDIDGGFVQVQDDKISVCLMV
ncbi:MAG: hypothetical protein Q8914_09340 [Bacteroidota bacterium]|nr:hypothetical protein [Bacteroidota bacterium]